MPSFSMTRRERTLAVVVNDTNLGEAQPLEAKGEHGPRRLRRVAAAPVLGREAPADLDRGQEGRREVGLATARPCR